MSTLTSSRAIQGLRSRFWLPIVLVACVLMAAAPSAAQSNCPGANPNDFDPDDAAINACLAAGGIVTLEDGWPGYWISNTLNLTVSGTVLTKVGATPPVLYATDNLWGPMLRVPEGVSDYQISELTFGGRVYARIYR